jgi:hypothetical protein
MASASLVMTGALGGGGVAGGLFAPPEPPPHALKANAAAAMQVAMRAEICISPSQNHDMVKLAAAEGRV